MENKPIDIKELFSSYKVVQKSDWNILIEEDTSTSKLLSILTILFLLIPLFATILLPVYGILYVSLISIILITFRILAVYDRPRSINVKKNCITLKYPKLFGGEKVVTYDLSMIKGMYPDPIPMRSQNWVGCVRLLLANDKSIKIFNEIAREEEVANDISDKVAKIFSELVGTKIIFPK